MNTKLQDARRKKFWSVEKAASQVNVTVRTYQRWEHAVCDPHLDSLGRLCDAFAMTADELGFGHLVGIFHPLPTEIVGDASTEAVKRSGLSSPPPEEQNRPRGLPLPDHVIYSDKVRPPANIEVYQPYSSGPYKDSALPISLSRLRIFLSCPADVVDELNLALGVIEQMRHDLSLLPDHMTLEVVTWNQQTENTSISEMHSPQEAMRLGLPMPSDCDIIIMVLWTRMGASLPREHDKMGSGSYFSCVHWQYQDALQRIRREDYPYMVIYRRTEKVIVDLDDPRLEQWKEQYEQVKRFCTQFASGTLSTRMVHSVYETPDDFRLSLEIMLKHIIHNILQTTQPVTLPQDRPVSARLPAQNLWHGSPFPGLRPFTTKDAPIFFGRGRETDSLIKQVSRSDIHFLAVVGASGSGKSSLIGAGLLPRLLKDGIAGGRNWNVLHFSPGEIGDNPFSALAVKLLPLLKNQDLRVRELAEDLFATPSRIGNATTLALAQSPVWARLLLFIDQFEELITLVADKYRGPFIDMLAFAATTSNIMTVVTLRADFYHKLIGWPQLAELLQTGSFPLAVPTTIELYEMIIRPSEQAGLTLEDDLAERILEDTGSDPGALPLMAYTLNELYHACENSKHLTHAVYQAMGGVQGVIAQRAETIFNQKLDDEAKMLLPHLFRELVEVDELGVATRRRAYIDDLSSNKAIARVIDALTDARLLFKSSGRNKRPTVEVAHEALMHNWPRLAGWIEETQDDLRLLRQVRLAAYEWETHQHNPAFLWLHERLSPVYDMIERIHPELDAVVQDFIRPELERMLDEINNASTSHFRRAQISDRLAVIGDTRQGVGVLPDGLPDLLLRAVPGGMVTLEKRAGEYLVNPFYMAVYPITYRQYLSFITAENGYDDGQWWTDLQHESTPGLQGRPLANHPAEKVSWYDAVAFCRWLTAMLLSTCDPPLSQATQLKHPVIRLPTEWEWQQAATGANKTALYPWGETWSSHLVNTSESGLSRTTAVGMYPLGVSPHQILDMSGNVQEWCLNEYKNPAHIKPGTGAARVLRGGSWGSNEYYARITTRSHLFPTDRYSDVGFRVVLAEADVEMITH